MTKQLATKELTMKSFWNTAAWVCLVVGTGAAALAAEQQAGADRAPVLLELFTSEGCSSCPPADRLLESLDRTQPIPGADLIVLSEHVDYWNHGGWSDPYSSKAYTDRQRDYVTKFGIESGYTPQLVVDGESEFVGSNAAKTRAAVEKAQSQQKTPVILTASREGKQLKVHVEVPDGASGKKPSTVYLALADNQAQSKVSGGENAGRSLTHVAVVRALMPLGTVSEAGGFTKDVTVSAGANHGLGGMRVVAFVQEKQSGHVIGVAQKKL